MITGRCGLRFREDDRFLDLALEFCPLCSCLTGDLFLLGDDKHSSKIHWNFVERNQGYLVR
ncbi:hypothetical protein V1477_018605 [Vespula maculifrons]|uniref:Uncharacterized protein n=1 Tax=Vespula maculifrons TaxID=7453 RepID=A0ABD2AVV0_VESMC